MTRNGNSAHPDGWRQGPRSGAGPETRNSRHSQNGRLAPPGQASPARVSPPNPACDEAAKGPQAQEATFSPADLRVLLHAMERSTGFVTCDDQARWLVLESRIELALGV